MPVRRVSSTDPNASVVPPARGSLGRCGCGVWLTPSQGPGESHSRRLARARPPLVSTVADRRARSLSGIEQRSAHAQASLQQAAVETRPQLSAIESSVVCNAGAVAAVAMDRHFQAVALGATAPLLGVVQPWSPPAGTLARRRNGAHARRCAGGQKPAATRDGPRRGVGLWRSGHGRRRRAAPTCYLPTCRTDPGTESVSAAITRWMIGSRSAMRFEREWMMTRPNGSPSSRC
jgi:hypothetical protein